MVYSLPALLSFFIVLAAVWGLPISAKVELPAIFSDHMVIQRSKPIPIWGKAASFATLQISLNGCVVSTRADLSGNWHTSLKAMPAGGPYDLVVRGTNTVAVHDVLIGDVWFCSGQSNMSLPCALIDFTQADLQLNHFENLRHFIRRNPNLGNKDLPSIWQIAAPENVPNFSAVAYYLSRELVSNANVPIGIIECPVGGSPIKTWISQSSLRNKSEFAGWVSSSLYDSLIVPISKCNIKGIVWYQGESDIYGAAEYPKFFAYLIRDWRKAFRDAKLPVFSVQLPNYGKRYPNPTDSLWAELREAQVKCANLPYVYLTINTDTAHNGALGADLHPATKMMVGHRLAQRVLATQYGVSGAVTNPRFRGVTELGSKLLVSFCCAQGGIVSLGTKVKGFAVAGPDKVFYWANAAIMPNRQDICVWNEIVAHPVAVRYGWADNPECNLYSSEGLPVTPFRTDNWRPAEFVGHDIAPKRRPAF